MPTPFLLQFFMSTVISRIGVTLGFYLIINRIKVNLLNNYQSKLLNICRNIR